MNETKQVTSDALPKGARVRLTPLRVISPKPRHGTVVCGKRGTIRCIKVDEADGYFPDVGDTYIDEIIGVEDPQQPGVYLPFVMTEKHAATMHRIRAMEW